MRVAARFGALLAGASLPFLPWSARATNPAESVLSYSQAQAERGGHLYAEQCASCHGGALEGHDAAPPLAGSAFLSNWTGQPVGALVTRIRRTMPLDNPDSLGVAASTEITAFILGTNGYPPGERELPADVRQQGQIQLGAAPPH